MSRAPRGPSDAEMRAYLLGRLPQERRDELQEQFFEDDASYDRLLEAEQDLIDEYARGTLSAKDARDVEAGLLASVERREDVRFARALWRAQKDRNVAPREDVKDRRYWVIAAGAAILAIGIAGWLAGQNDKLKTELAGARHTQTPPAPVSAPAAVTPAVAAFLLVPEVRGSSSHLLDIPKGAQFVKVELADVRGSSQYSVEVHRSGAQNVWQQDGLQPSSNGAITVWLPAPVLRSGNYEFLAYAQNGQQRELAGSYECRVNAP